MSPGVAALYHLHQPPMRVMLRRHLLLSIPVLVGAMFLVGVSPAYAVPLYAGYLYLGVPFMAVTALGKDRADGTLEFLCGLPVYGRQLALGRVLVLGEACVLTGLWLTTTRNRRPRAAKPSLDGRSGQTPGEMILDLHIELWGPSTDAGIVSAADLRGWRERPAFIRGSRHVPPRPTKVGRYMAQLVDQLNDLEIGPLTRAILTHWGFVHIHPFMDGNGRLARLLINYQLAGAGLPWTTIRAEQRAAYFAALERAHIEDDLVALASLLRADVERAARRR